MLGLSTTELILIILAIALLFGASRLPQLAKSLGQSRNAFKEALREGQRRGRRHRTVPPKQIATRAASSLSDAEILAEMQRRADARAEV